MPVRVTTPSLFQSFADLIERTSFDSTPREHLPDRLGLGELHDVSGLAASFLLGDVSVSIRGLGQGADLTRPRREEPAAATPLADLGPLVFGDHPLDLQQQPALGALIEIPVEEDDLDAMAAQFVDQDHLIGVVARQPVGVLDVEPVDRPGGGGVAQPLQGRAEQQVSPE